MAYRGGGGGGGGQIPTETGPKVSYERLDVQFITIANYKLLSQNRMDY